MSFNDELLDLLLKRDLLLQRVSNGLSKDMAKDYLKMIDEAISIIGKSDITVVNMNKVIKEISDYITLDYPKVESNLKDISFTEANHIPNSINALVGVDIVTNKLSESLTNKIVKNSILNDGYTIKEGFEKLNEKLQATFQNQIRLGVLNGSTNQEIIRNLKPYMTDFTDNKIEAMVKTAISTVVNNTRMDTYKENEDIFKGYQWHATLDSRTRKEHFLLDGALWDTNGKGLNEKGKKYKFRNAPDGYRCRCVLLPITKSYKELGLNIDEIPTGTRSSMNGYVPADLNATDWFEKQGKDFQKKYLGTQRYELFKSGKITLSDLVNQKGKVLTIQELKNLS